MPGTLIANHVASDIFEKLGPREDLTIDSLNVMKDRSEVGLELVAWFRNDTRLLIAATQAVVDDGFNNWLKEHHQEISAQTFALGWLACLTPLPNIHFRFSHKHEAGAKLDIDRFVKQLGWMQLMTCLIGVLRKHDAQAPQLFNEAIDV